MSSQELNRALQANWLEGRKSYPYMKPNEYFFLQQELNVKNYQQYVAAKRENRIRHCIPYKGKYFDYIVKKEFNTIEEWTSDAGGKLTDILFGSNRVHKGETPDYTSFTSLLRLFHIYDLPEVEEQKSKDELTNMLDLEMKMRGLTLDNVWIIAGGNPTQWKDFIKT